MKPHPHPSSVRLRASWLGSLCLLFSIGLVTAQERMPLKDVSIDQFVRDTQVQIDSDDHHIAIAWWIPHEYWLSIFARDEETSDETRQAILNTLAQYTLLGVVQADISPIGSFDYYSHAEVKSSLAASIPGVGEEIYILPFVQEPDADLKLLLDTIRPMLTNSMGNLGSSFRFFILERFDHESRPHLDPYVEGSLTVDLRKRDGEAINAKIPFPVDALFVPRLCPNGKPAHVTWNFCPWTGEKLEDS